MAMRLLTAEDLAEMLRVSTYHAYDLLRRGAIPTVRLGRLVRVREEDVRAFIERSSQPHSDGKEL